MLIGFVWFVTGFGVGYLFTAVVLEARFKKYLRELKEGEEGNG